MPEQFLYRTKIGATVKKMSCKCVPQRVRVGWRWCSAVKKSTDISRTETGSFAIEKHGVGRRYGCCHYPPAMTEPLFKCFDGRRAEGNDALF